MKKFIAIMCSVALIASSITVSASTDFSEFDGDVSDNPWGELFTTVAPPTTETTTAEVTTQEPTTEQPTTPEITTPEPTTEQPTTQEVTTPEPTTEEPTTQEVTTPEPTTEVATTQVVTTQEPTTEVATTSEVITKKPLKIVSQPQSVEAKAGEYIKLSVTATGEGLTYQWQMSDDSGATWSNSAAKGDTPNNIFLLMRAELDGRQYRCIITDSYNNTVISDAATLSFIGVTITSQPKSVTAQAGEYIKLSVTATGEGLTYQWQMSNDNGVTWSNSAAKGDAPNNIFLLMRAEIDGRQYRCLITDSYNNTVISDSATLNLKNTGAIITSQPKSVTAQAGEYIKMSVTATGKGLTYQWQMSDDNGATWSNSAAKGDAPNNIFLLMRAEIDGRQYRCIITDSYNNIVISNAATLSFIGVTITSQPKSITAQAGEYIKMSVTATGKGLTYQWQMSDDNGATWSNSAAKGDAPNNIFLLMRAEIDGRQYRCIITDSGSNTAISNAATLSFAGTIITSQPKDVAAQAGEYIKMSVTATGSGLTYQWQMSDDNGATWSNSAAKGDAPNNIFLLMRAEIDGRQYRCVITDSDNNIVTSNAATLALK